MLGPCCQSRSTASRPLDLWPHMAGSSMVARSVGWLLDLRQAAMHACRLKLSEK